MEEQKQLQRITSLAQDILVMLRNESFQNHDAHIRDSIEHLAGTVAALSKIILEEDLDKHSTFQYSVTKMRVAKNIVEREKNAQTL